MSNEYYGAASTPTEDFLAHYGVKGMKWGVRKAVQSGNMRKLSRQYNKAAKKLAKLEKRAASGKKYAKRAAALGAGAALAGGVAATGTRGIGAVTRGAGQGAGAALRGVAMGVHGAAKLGGKLGIKGASKLHGVGRALYSAGNKTQMATNKAGSAVEAWGKGDSIGQGARKGAYELMKANPKMAGKVNSALRNTGHAGLGRQADKLGKISNSGYTRLAGAAVGAGLGAGAAYNAYRAATTKRAAKKAAQFRSEMNKAFAGTAYANGRPASQKKKKRR